MPDKKVSIVKWTENSLKNAIAIKNYLKENFSEKEIDYFYSLLFNFEEVISYFPELYPQINKKYKIRRAVLSKEVSLFYTTELRMIRVLAIIDNRCDISKWLS